MNEKIDGPLFSRHEQLFSGRNQKRRRVLISYEKNYSSRKEQFKVELKFFSIVISSVTIRNSFFCTVKTHLCDTQHVIPKPFACCSKNCSAYRLVCVPICLKFQFKGTAELVNEIEASFFSTFSFGERGNSPYSFVSLGKEARDI